MGWGGGALPGDSGCPLPYDPYWVWLVARRSWLFAACSFALRGKVHVVDYGTRGLLAAERTLDAIQLMLMQVAARPGGAS